MRNSKITAIVLSAIIGIGVGTGGTLVYENNQEAKQISKLEQTTKANAVEEIVKGNGFSNFMATKFWRGKGFKI